MCVDPLDVEAIRGGLAALLADPSLRRQYRQAGLARAAEFSWRTTAEQVIDIYGETVAAVSTGARP